MAALHELDPRESHEHSSHTTILEQGGDELIRSINCEAEWLCIVLVYGCIPQKSTTLLSGSGRLHRHHHKRLNSCAVLSRPADK